VDASLARLFRVKRSLDVDSADIKVLYVPPSGVDREERQKRADDEHKFNCRCS